MLMIAGGVVLSLIRFWTAISPPNVVRLSSHDATSIVALGAAALAYSAPRIASPSSPFVPGFVQLFEPEGGAGCTVVSEPAVKVESPNVERNVAPSAVLKRFVSWITTTA